MTKQHNQVQNATACPNQRFMIEYVRFTKQYVAVAFVLKTSACTSAFEAATRQSPSNTAAT